MKTMKKLATAWMLGAVTLSLSLSAHADILTFEDAYLGQNLPSLSGTAPLLTIDGFTFETQAGVTNDNQETTWGHGVTYLPDGPYLAGTGSQMFYLAAYGPFYETISSTNQFSISSLDIVPFVDFGESNRTLTIKGFLDNSLVNTVELLIAASALPDYTYGLTGFDNINKLQIGWLCNTVNDPGCQDTGYVAIDNLNVQVSAVPLPGAALLMASALGLGGFVARRRQRPA